MPVRYVLRKYPFRENQYTAQVKPFSALSLNDIVDNMLQHGSTVTRADIVGVLELFFTTIEDSVIEGHSVNLPMCNYGAVIKGVFDSSDASVHHTQHVVHAAVSPGTRFKKSVSMRAEVRKMESSLPVPEPGCFTDLASGQRNAILTPGNLGELYGSRLKIDTSDADQGIFIISEDKTETKVEVLATNVSIRLIFLIPQLGPGTYTMEVRKCFKSQDIRTGKLPVALTV